MYRQGQHHGTVYRCVQCSSAYLKMRWHHSEIDKLSRNPELPVSYHSRLQIIAQLVLDLMTLALQCLHCMNAPASLTPRKLMPVGSSNHPRQGHTEELATQKSSPVGEWSNAVSCW